VHSPPKFEMLIALGSSSGDRLKMLDQARQMIHLQVGPIQNRSKIYETPPWGGVAQNQFLNAVLLVHSHFSPLETLQKLLRIEADLGRTRENRWSDRCIDLDLLLMKSTETRQTLELLSDTLIIPHPHMLERDFCLVPAAEVAPDWIHPKTNRTLREELQASSFHLQASDHSWMDQK
jgi:2-amino-4-hydroxy-6-hydroxymethyldihydropteridine diphosphokinase